MAESEYIKLSLRHQDLNLGGGESISRDKLELKGLESSEKIILLVIRHSELGPPPPDNADISPFLPVPSSAVPPWAASREPAKHHTAYLD